MSAPNRPLVSVVVPVMNEEEHVPEMLRRLRTVPADEPSYRFEFLFVDDGSTDATAQLLSEAAGRDRRVRLIELTRNFGHQIALTAGLREARGDAVVTLDGDLQHPPEVIHDFLARWEGGSSIVIAVRSASQEGGFKRRSARLFYRLINLCSEVPIVPDAADFRLLSREAADQLLSLRERARFLRGLVGWLGYDTAVVTYDEAPRTRGRTKYSLRRMVWFAADALTSFSPVPLRVATVAGAVTSAGAAVYAIYVIASMILYPARIVPGWASLVLVMLFLGGIQLLCLGIMGEYLYRVFQEVKGRPLYIVRRRVGGGERVGREDVTDRREQLPERQLETPGPRRGAPS